MNISVLVLFWRFFLNIKDQNVQQKIKPQHIYRKYKLCNLNMSWQITYTCRITQTRNVTHLWLK